jgi:hypothetical protein
MEWCMNHRVNFDNTANPLELQWTLSSQNRNGERHTCIRLSGNSWKQAGIEIHIVESVGHWCVSVCPCNHVATTLEFHEVYDTRSGSCCSAADCFLRERSTRRGSRTDHLGHFVFEFPWCEAVSSFMSYSLCVTGWRTRHVRGAHLISEMAVQHFTQISVALTYLSFWEYGTWESQ